MTEDEAASLTTRQVAVILRVDPSTVSRAPRESLPYETTPGGMVRGGRRRYRPSDVERYREILASERSAEPPPADRLAAVEADVAELRRWRDAHERGHGA